MKYTVIDRRTYGQKDSHNFSKMNNDRFPPILPSIPRYGTDPATTYLSSLWNRVRPEAAAATPAVETNQTKQEPREQNPAKEILSNHKMRRGPNFSPAESRKLLAVVETVGKRWNVVAKHMLLGPPPYIPRPPLCYLRKYRRLVAPAGQASRNPKTKPVALVKGMVATTTGTSSSSEIDVNYSICNDRDDDVADETSGEGLDSPLYTATKGEVESRIRPEAQQMKEPQEDLAAMQKQPDLKVAEALVDKEATASDPNHQERTETMREAVRINTQIWAILQKMRNDVGTPQFDMHEQIDRIEAMIDQQKQIIDEAFGGEEQQPPCGTSVYVRCQHYASI